MPFPPPGTRERRRLPTPDAVVAPPPPAPRVPTGAPAALLAWAAADADATVLVELGPREPRVVWVNRACGQLLGYAEADLVGAPLSRLQRSEFALPDEDAPSPELDPVRVTRRAVHLERRDGERLRVVASATPVGTAVVPQWVLRLVPDVDVARMEQDLVTSRERFRALADQAPVGIFSSERGLRLGYVNDRFCALLGRSAERLLGTDWLEHLDAEDVEQVMSALQSVLEGSAVELPLRVRRTDGEERRVRARVVPVRDGRDAGFLGTLEDVTEREQWEEQLSHQALHDPLTGLPNRRALLAQAARALSSGAPVALALLDLDDFKQVNDSRGHEAGDRLLQDVARRLCATVRDTDLVARLGGDEFAVLASPVDGEQGAGRLAARLVAALGEVGTGPESLLRPSASVGVALATTGSSTDGLLRAADAAMYEAKSRGKRGWALFDDEARARLQRRLALLEGLRGELVSPEGLWVAYQPLVRTADGALEGVEALARWSSPALGPVPPQEFVELAERHGLVTALGEHVLRTACLDLARADAELGPRAPATLSVNLSPLQLRAPHLPHLVRDCLEEAGLQPERLCLEVTEGALMLDRDAAAGVLRTVRETGVRIALDDFGTGWSSLAVLRDLPVDQLKVDRSFLRDGPPDALVAAVVRLAEALGLETVAEGVETEQQRAGLEALGCPLAQGYLFSRPLPLPQLLARCAASS